MFFKYFFYTSVTPTNELQTKCILVDRAPFHKTAMRTSSPITHSNACYNEIGELVLMTLS